MKKIPIYVLVISAALLIPKRGTDVGKLQPVEVVSLYKDEGAIVLETDTGDIGRGDTLPAAYTDLEKTTSGTLFLDTGEYLLVAPDMGTLMPKMREYMKRDTKVCEAESGIDLTLAAEYLNEHPPEMTLEEVQSTDKLPLLRQEKYGEKIILKICN